jgi:hypothetical protein
MRNKIRNFLWLLFIIITIFLVAGRKKQKEENPIIKLNATVSLVGDQIEVHNHDNFDYVKTKLTINEHYHLIGFNLNAGEKYTFWQVEFAHSNRKRMRIREKPIKFSIWCELPDGKNGFYFTEFK